MDWRRRRKIRYALSHLGIPLKQNPILPPGVAIGRHTYGYGDDTFQVFLESAQIDVGAFCSIHPAARVLAGSEHVMTRASTFPFNARLFTPSPGEINEAIDKGTTMIGNDVWIGMGAIILSGVIVGDGAVIGAGAVVGKAVPPYAVVIGNPAKILRYRFDSRTRRRLLALGWWHWDDDAVRAAKRWFMADIESFLDEMELRHPPAGDSDLVRRLGELPPDLVTPHRPADTA